MDKGTLRDVIRENSGFEGSSLDVKKTEGTEFSDPIKSRLTPRSAQLGAASGWLGAAGTAPLPPAPWSSELTPSSAQLSAAPRARNIFPPPPGAWGLLRQELWPPATWAD